MEVSTERLLIIPCNEENYRVQSRLYEMGPHILSYLDQVRDDPTTIGWGVWFVQQKESLQVIGDIGFKGKPHQRTVEVGYGMQPSHHNKGFATEAVSGLLHWAFSTGLVDRVIAECSVDNGPSFRVLEKVGMKQVSVSDGMIYWELS
ncbi:GNAT family N-acetyltransferase [Paenibacillus soyae]|uniref:GNAT family N-acetyltransferase n=1 Tax=Paenibacillus soyae TaxID=2969249 RepID=A0A9X2MP33_9BACL|nr:GNAT family N-acetyltransferase [Paenibacillus soyae]MCR2805573.1 GNAT family N-acetyltransferase [Paenibacillus soyae]